MLCHVTIYYYCKSTTETRGGRHKNAGFSADRSYTKKKKHKKKQDRPKKIPKISEEEVEKITKIKTEVLESESMLDPASGNMAGSTLEKTGGRRVKMTFLSNLTLKYPFVN